MNSPRITIRGEPTSEFRVKIVRTLYKYYSGLKPNYFNQPTLKLTSAFNLNDPFEVTLAEELLTLIEEKNKDDESFEQFKRVLGTGDLKAGYNKLMRMCGIVSLSETQHNLLMWAHYADQHRGMCIGYDSGFLEKRNFERSYKKLPLIKTPIKIDYDTKKNDFQNYNFDTTNSDLMLKSILVKQLTTKGDDWIYEKEHRLIIPIGRADRFLFKQGRGSQSIPMPNSIRKVVEETSENEYKIKSNGDVIASQVGTDTRYTFLLNIDKEYIKNVYLGCRMPPRTANRIKKEIREDPELSHVSVYKFRESLNRFELEIDPRY
ncbi:DUF2971 domain-containing protein [Aeromonas veronii]|uniref:DUF2971 domain-containing protein n=1 Tax=Aeromonas veronii TaxID=654 RepID=UPI001F4208AB|nr:DUF2971 domain-containing protein [Aeromonas veronii]MCF5725844.1 DUF2971 domain-containing protein [Aeromonas veronii]